MQDCIITGDPLRAKWIADTYLQEVRQVNGVRNMLGFTGVLDWNDERMTCIRTRWWYGNENKWHLYT